MLLIKNGKILTMAEADYENGYILVEQGKISKIGGSLNELEEEIRERTDLKIIDANGLYVLPGLIDAHCHVGMWEDAVGIEGDDGNEMTDPVTPQLRAIDGIYHTDRAFTEAREGGVTTVVTGPGSANVIGGQFAALKTVGRRIEEMILKEPVAVKVAFGENPKTVYSERKQMPSTRMSTAAILRESLMKAKEYQQMLEEYNQDKENNDKPDYDMKMEALIKVLNKEIPLKAHAHRSDDILTAIRIAREFDVDLTIEHCTEGHLISDILIEEGIPAIVGPILSDRSKVELKNQDVRTAGILSEAGVKTALMTDHPVIPIQYLSLCAAVAVREGMSEENALKAITINAAEITGISDRVGSLEVGKDADIVLFDGHPFELRTKVKMTIIDGNIVYERKQDEAV